MSDISYISDRLTSLKFPAEVVDQYRQSHRHYHNLRHLTEVVAHLCLLKDFDDELFLAAVYHDAVYDPKAGDNEERSAQLFMAHSKDSELKDQQKKNIRQMILDTKTHVASSEKSRALIDADLNILSQPFSRQLEFEHQIFKEYQFTSYNNYREKRLEVLTSLNKNGALDMLIGYVRYRKPMIGVFCGSFNPFHKGHYNVLQKAEKIFDKVIIAFGKNPDKDDRHWPVPKQIRYHQLEEYSSLLTDFIDSLDHEVVVVRGLRNSTDFQYEQNQYRYIQELKPGIRIINIFCDKEFEHISSSGIRTLEKYNKHQSYLLD
jgi:pantetheine-phosphate adenylyltransferase